MIEARSFCVARAKMAVVRGTDAHATHDITLTLAAGLVLQTRGRALPGARARGVAAISPTVDVAVV